MGQERITRAQVMGTVPIIHPTIFYDDCNGTHTYTVTGTGADFSSSYSAAKAYAGLKSLLLATRVTAPAAGDLCTVLKAMWLPPTKLVTLRILYARESSVLKPFTTFKFEWYDGTNKYSSALQHDLDLNTFKYMDVSTAWVSLPTLAPCNLYMVWNYLEFKIDYSLGCYHSVTLNHKFADMKNIPCYPLASATVPHLELSLIIQAQTNAQCWGIFSNILVTGENL